MPTVAMPVLLLLHVPPVTGLLSVVVAPTHALAVPVTADSELLTVTVIDRVHPVGSIYEISADPVATAVTTPVPDTEAMPLLLLSHTPLIVASVNVTTEPTHIDDVPKITAGNGLTVTMAKVLQPPVSA
jgi:hypothetical protein